MFKMYNITFLYTYLDLVAQFWGQIEFPFKGLLHDRQTMTTDLSKRLTLAHPFDHTSQTAPRCVFHQQSYLHQTNIHKEVLGNIKSLTWSPSPDHTSHTEPPCLAHQHPCLHCGKSGAETT